MPAGKTAVISGEDLSLKFVEVTMDSRCPTGVQCIQAGEGRCKVSVTYQGKTSEVIFTVPGSSPGTQELTGGYQASFNLEPYPEAGKQIAQNEYKLVITITG